MPPLGRGPLAAFNHNYGVVPKETSDALASSGYLRERFVDVEVRTTVRPDSTYTGTYLNGRDTYTELMVVGECGLSRGDFGLALSADREGADDEIARRWAAEFGPQGLERGSIHRSKDGVTTPWFNLIRPAWSDGPCKTGLWTMTYAPTEGATVPRTRREERASRFDPTKLAREVRSLVAALPEADLDPLERSLRSLRFEVRPVRDGGFEVEGPPDGEATASWKFLPKTEEREGLIGLGFSICRAERHVEEFPGATLEVAPEGLPIARFWFTEPTDEEVAFVTQRADPGASRSP